MSSGFTEATTILVTCSSVSDIPSDIYNSNAKFVPAYLCLTNTALRTKYISHVTTSSAFVFIINTMLRSFCKCCVIFHLGQIRIYSRFTLLGLSYLPGLDRKASFPETLDEMIQKGHGLKLIAQQVTGLV